MATQIPPSLRRLLFFAFLLALFLFLALWAQPLVHPYFDQVGIRDAGTTLSSIVTGPRPIATFIDRAMLHVEGPLQFTLLNGYIHAVGDFLPLSPAVVAFPNALLALGAVVFAYLLGRKTHSEELGYWCALAFSLGPWLGESLRQPWYFNSLSCFLQFSVLYSFVSLARDPESRRYRVAAPAFLAAYLSTGMDWPSFLFSLGLFMLLSGRLRVFLRNPYNVLPLAVVAAHVAWPIVLYSTGREGFLPVTMLLYPFLRYTDLTQNPDFWGRVWNNVVVGWGPLVLFAPAGIVIYFAYVRRMMPDRVVRALFDASSVWFIGGHYALIKSSTSATYLYVVAVPTALLASLAFVRLRLSHGIAIAAILLSVQVYVTATRHFSEDINAGRRVLAAATFLLEQRPDLLAREKTAFLPRNMAANVGQYARGQNKRIVMPQEFPVERHKHAIGSDETVLLAFVDAYNRDGLISADWVVLDSELFSGDLQASGFYGRIAKDSKIRWIACFRDSGGEMFIGEVTPGQGSPMEEAPKLDTDMLSRMYRDRYDRISHLKKNVEYVDHY